MEVFQGDKQAQTGRYAIIVSRYNDTITSKLLDGALNTLDQHGVDGANIDIGWVPGAWEIPVTAKRMASTGRYVAILCLGAVIRGETRHDHYINHQVSGTLGNLAVEFNLPILFGILTCESLEQAIHRAGGRVGNKGVECAEAALEMASLFAKLPT